MEGLKAGDVVRLKSGGPKMTVQGEGDFEGQILCQWFDKGEVKIGSFPAVSLEAA
jgi:uncharacterized protein YodC (DUF2158 family)